MSKKDLGALSDTIMKKRQKEQRRNDERAERIRRNPEAYGNRS